MSMDTTIGEMQKDPNFGLILLGALLWIAGSYIPFIGPFFLTIGFGIVCTAAAITSLTRSSENAVFGLLLGGIIQVIGYYLAGVLLIGLIAPIPIVLGGVLIIYFAIPLAIQTGRVPFIEEFQKKIDAQRHKDEKVVDADVVESDDEDSFDDSAAN
ncbi:MAG: hypothetical protein ACFFDR_03170 [Candidatus Thorarchaeota archaeon]